MEVRKNSDSYSSILKYAALFGGVQGVSILMALVRNKIIAVLLGPQGMGLQSLFNSTTRFVGDVSNMGISTSAVRFLSVALSSGDERKVKVAIRIVRSWSLLAAVIGLVLCAAISPLLNKMTFSWGDHTLHFVLLSPVIALTSITVGETAILKSMRQLKQLASISVWSMAAILVATTPMYFFFGEAAIVPAIFVAALAQMLLTVGFSWRKFPLSVSLRRSVLAKGKKIVTLGWAFMIAAAMGSGAEFFIRSVISNQGTLLDVGLYNSAFMLMMTYSGMMLASMETDYYPRLSAVADCGGELNNIVNRQMEVEVLILSPLLAALSTFLPVVVPLLFSRDFTPVVHLSQILVMAIFLKTLRAPMSYIALSRGDARTYLLLEGAYAVVEFASVAAAYLTWGLQSTCYALLFTAVFELLLLIFYTRRRYGFTISRQVAGYALPHFALIAALTLTAMLTESWLYWTLSVLLTTLSVVFSIHVLRRKTHLWQALKKKIRK